MDITDCTKEMLKRSGIRQSELSRRLGKSRSYVATTLNKRADIGASNAAKMAELMGYRLSFRRGKEEIEVTPRGDDEDADDNQGAAD